MNITSEEQTNISSESSVFVVGGLNYSSVGEKTLDVNVNSSVDSDDYTHSFNIKGLEIQDYSLFQNNATDKVMAFSVFNHWPETQSVDWNVSDPYISSDEAMNVSYNDKMFFIVAMNYSEQGMQEPMLYTYSSSLNDSYTDIFVNKMLEITEFNILQDSQSSAISEAWFTNNIERRNVSWSYDTGEKVLNSTDVIELNNSQQVYVIIGTNYSSDNAYWTNFSINSSVYSDEARGVVSI